MYSLLHNKILLLLARGRRSIWPNHVNSCVPILFIFSLLFIFFGVTKNPFVNFLELNLTNWYQSFFGGFGFCGNKDNNKNYRWEIWQEYKFRDMVVQNKGHFGSKRSWSNATENWEKIRGCDIWNKFKATEAFAKAMWNKFKALYIKTTVENRLYLKQSLYMIRMT